MNFKSELIDSLVELTKSSKFLTVSEVLFLQTDAEIFEKLEFARTMSNSCIKRIAAITTQKDIGSAWDENGINEDFGAVVDLLDDLFERSNIWLEVATGKGKGPNSKQEFKVVHPERTQLKLNEPVDNSNKPWIPIIKYKPNAIKPLPSSIVSKELHNHLQEFDKLSVPHPYEYEIENIRYPKDMFLIKDHIMYKGIQNTELFWIETQAELEKMVKILNNSKEIAVDLEHHDYRSFQGFTCLIQISTRNEDFIIDAIALRSQLHVLNESFTNPAILKVLHGAEMDIIWLQRDFGVYIVNLFDTFHASHDLAMAKHSFAHLLDTFCDIKADKKYQRADWRLRPLTKEMIHYARSDTHYLLYIYDIMRNELLADESSNLMLNTLQNSAQTSLKQYMMNIYDAVNGEGNGGWKNLLQKSNEILNNENVAVFRSLHAWRWIFFETNSPRDYMARKEDESPAYVLPNHLLFKLSRFMPTTAKDVIGGCSPIPTLVRINADALANLIDQAILSVREAEEKPKPVITLIPSPKTISSNKKRVISSIQVEILVKSNFFGDVLAHDIESPGRIKARKIESENLSQ